MDLSIVICTYNRRTLVVDALQRLLSQDIRPFRAEIIAVDNNSDDGTAEALGRLSASAPDLRCVRETRQGISHARNRGVAMARAPIVAFTDDDVVVRANWGRTILRAFREHADVDGVGGKVLPAWPSTPPPWLTCEHWSPLAVLDYGPHPAVLDAADPRCLIGANVAFRKEVFERLGGFSPAVQRVKNGIGSIEDHEFLLRFWQSGGRALYLPDLIATACVDPVRLGKSYHRRWHEGHGHFHAIMRAPYLETSARGPILGVPAHLYRQAVEDTARLAGTVLRGRFDRAFLHEARLRFFKGFFRTRVREYVAGRLHQLDDRLVRRRRARRQVMFEAANPMLFDVFRPIYDRLQSDPRVDVVLVPYGREFSGREIFAAARGRHRIVSPRRAALMKPDVYINTDLWSMTWLRRRTRRIHLFHGVAGKYGLDAPLELADAVRAFDRILFPNEDRLNRYAAAGLVDPNGPVARLTGYPKIDCLVDGSLDRQTVLQDMGLDPARRTVVYAPTWSEHSSLNTVGERVIRSVAARRDLNVIVKLHACSYTDRGSGGIDWRRRLAAEGFGPNVRVACGADASPFLAAADLLITDHSTVGFEFLVLDRPLVVIHQPALIEHAGINREKVALLQSAARVVGDVENIDAVVCEELADPARLSSIRRQVAQRMFYRAGEATELALASIYDLIDLPARTDSVTPASCASVTSLWGRLLSSRS